MIFQWLYLCRCMFDLFIVQGVYWFMCRHRLQLVLFIRRIYTFCLTGFSLSIDMRGKLFLEFVREIGLSTVVFLTCVHSSPFQNTRKKIMFLKIISNSMHFTIVSSVRRSTLVIKQKNLRITEYENNFFNDMFEL